MSDDGGGGGGDCGGGDSGCGGGGDSGGGVDSNCGGVGDSTGGVDSSCDSGADYGSNSGGCDSSHDVGTSHNNSSHAYIGGDNSSHATHHNHSNNLATYEEALEPVQHISHNLNRHLVNHQLSADCAKENNRDDSTCDNQHQANLFNSHHTSIDLYDQQNDFDSSTKYNKRRSQAQPSSTNQRKKGWRKRITDCLMIAFGVTVSLVVLILPCLPF